MTCAEAQQARQIKDMWCQTCGAMPGSRCRSMITGKHLAKPHRVRAEAHRQIVADRKRWRVESEA